MCSGTLHCVAVALAILCMPTAAAPLSSAAIHSAQHGGFQQLGLVPACVPLAFTDQVNNKRYVCVQHELPVKGHGSTPFAVATAVMLQRSSAASSSAREPVVLVAALADIGVTGAYGCGTAAWQCTPL